MFIPCIYLDRKYVISTSIVLSFHMQVWIRKNPADLGHLCKRSRGIRLQGQTFMVFNNELLLTVIVLNEIINTFQSVRKFLRYKGTKSEVMTGRYRVYLLPSFFLTETRSWFLMQALQRQNGQKELHSMN